MAENNVLQLMKKVKTKSISLNDGEIEVKELTVNQVNEFMEVAKHLENAESFEENKKSLAMVVRFGVVGMEAVKDKDFDDMPITTLKDVAEKVLQFNGLNIATVEEGKTGND